jgi:hypothetical protein
VNRLLRLTLLAPDFQEAILDGRQPKGMQLEEQIVTIPSGWGGAAGRPFIGRVEVARFSPHFAGAPALPFRPAASSITEG